jgi:hypothetical protein
MEQPETPKDPAPAPPPADPPPPPAAKVELPDPGGALAIPDNFRLPFHGKMVTPTAVPSASDRLYNLNLIQKRRRRRGFLVGLLSGQLLIIAMDVGGMLFLRTHPQVTLRAPVGVSAVVFLGMAIGSAVMLLALSVIFTSLALKAVFGRRNVGLFTSLGRGIRRLVQTGLVLGVCMAVILGTAWFMIPGAEWRPTLEFARAQGKQVLESAKSRFRPPAPLDGPGR